VTNSRIVTGPIRALATRPPAVEPISGANTVLPRILPGADGVETESTPSLGARPRVTTQEPTADAVRTQRLGSAVVVSTTVTVDRPAHLTVSVVATKPPRPGSLTLLKQSAVAGVRSGRQHTSLTADPQPAGEAVIRLRLSPGVVRPGGSYKLQLTAKDVVSDRSSTLLLPFRL
jgi:hypothetical protein